LTVIASTVSGNSAGLGGGVFSGGSSSGSATLSIVNSTVSGNSANFGGGIFNDGLFFGSATLAILNSTLSGNSDAFGYGGGIYNRNATLEIGSTILNAG